jgi:methylphosphotriester-DNA--protein-cysteine methyltransferase
MYAKLDRRGHLFRAHQSQIDEVIDMEFPTSLVSSVDQYWNEIRGADLNFIITSRPVMPWRLVRFVGKACAIQIGVGGGASVTDGKTPKDAYSLIWLYERPDKPTFLNGEIVRPEHICLVPPDSRFIANSEGTRLWMSVSIPTAALSTLGAIPRISHTQLVLSDALGTMTSLARAYECLAIVDSTASQLARIEEQIIKQSMAIFDACASPSTPSEDFRRSFNLVSSALEYLGPEQLGHVKMEELADVSKVSTRTILRAFRQVARMGTKRYLRFRQLNLARRALVQSVNPSETVTDILLGVGVSEFGRFSGAYQRLFGERPSHTLAAARRRLDPTNLRPSSDILRRHESKTA